LACWAAHEAGPEEREGGEGKRERFNYFLKRHQTNEFKLKLEFKQAKATHQHECNNKLLQFIYLVSEIFKCLKELKTTLYSL
jgi:hypothetical protein